MLLYSLWPEKQFLINNFYIQVDLTHCFKRIKNLAACEALPNGRTYGERARCFGSIGVFIIVLNHDKGG